jgi:hypothetical protein
MTIRPQTNKPIYDQAPRDQIPLAPAQCVHRKRFRAGYAGALRLIAGRLIGDWMAEGRREGFFFVKKKQKTF